MWTATALASEASEQEGVAWRVVEDQYRASTRKIVDTKDDQELLEDILEESKPFVPHGAENLHYLLQTPFRYSSPYPIGSRFRRAGSTEGVFYAAKEIRTALAELCYYRLRFFQESPDTPFPCEQERLTVFSINYHSNFSINLTQPPFVKDEKTWMHPSNYETTQAFADSAREAGIEVICYKSVRDLNNGLNIALLSPKAFSAHTPLKMQTWFLYLSKAEANCERAAASHPDDYLTFKLEQFG